METSENCFEKKRLETIYTQKEQKPVQETKVFSVLNSVWQRLVTFLTQEPEIKVWKKSDRFGNIWWEVYDPFSGRSATFGCEVDMLEWVEKRYYGNNKSMF
ncbi:hypothetical protein [Coleofasciculus sp. FACHB-SPT9]|uniref:hypothetical protein n=1 Tax=Cyanophyceae TaxID=3028117 RepID=UPI0018EFE9B7|nr:hypothetical protein [Coleofasciculus sp. FACHB-SPT9]